MTAKNVAAALRMQAHSLIVAKNKINDADKLEYDSLLKFTLKLIQELANHKVAQAIMLENISEQLSNVDFKLLDESESDDLMPLSKPPFNID